MIRALSIPGGVNSSPPEQNDRHFSDDIFKCIFINEKFCVFVQISLEFVPKGPIDNKSGSGNGWARSRRQAIIWEMLTQFTDAYMRHLGEMS